MPEDNGGRQMFQGNWACGKCGKPVTQLPFQPDPARLGQITCRDCYQPGAGGGNGGGTKPMFQGNWKCGKCSSAITELPFQPKPEREGELTCRNCFLSSRG